MPNLRELLDFPFEYQLEKIPSEFQIANNLGPRIS